MNSSIAHPQAEVHARQPSGASSWEAFLAPSRTFAHPAHVVSSPDLTREEKRAILASWASDVRAIESAPALRSCPGLVGRSVPLDDVLAALRSLDPEHEPAPGRTARGERPQAARGCRIRRLTPRRRATVN